MYLLVVLVTISAVAASAYVPATNGEHVSLQTLLERIERMEYRHATAIELMETRHAVAFKSMESKHADAIESMESKHANAIESMASKHTEEIQRLSVKHEEDIQMLTTRVENSERATMLVVDKLSSTEEAKDEGTDNSKDATDLPGQGDMKELTSTPKRNSGQGNKITSPMRRLYEGNNIAFSAYLDHDLNSVGTDQVIVMNQVLLNDGNGYSKHTGVFTAPIDGVYSFSFFIGENDINQIFVRLTVNSNPEVDAIVDTFHIHQDAQGGNTINLKLSAGDSVMLKHSRTHFHDSDHVEGGTGGRFTTFSGFLLYPTDNAPIVGK